MPVDKRQMVVLGRVKISSSSPKTLPYIVTMPSQNINARIVAPIVNPELILVDSYLEEDLEEIQCEVLAEQAQIEEAAQAKLAAAREHIEKKRKAKEEEPQKAEEVQKAEEMWKAEEDKVVREKARKRQLEVHLTTSLIFLFYFIYFLKADRFQMLQKRKEAKKAWWVDVDGVSTGNKVSSIQN